MRGGSGSPGVAVAAVGDNRGMSDPGTGEDPPGRALLVALAAMAGVALLVGLAVGGAAMSVLELTGVGGSETRPSKAEATLFMPKYRPTQKPGNDRKAPEPRASNAPDKKPPKPSPKVDQIQLSVTPQQVSSGGRINFRGTYPDRAGATLQVQRQESGIWVDFPVTATVQAGGAFETWISTTRTGRSQFRVYDKQADRPSNVVAVTIG